MFVNFSITEAPVLLSTPHFYLGDEKYVNAFTGLKPVKEWHETHFDLEPVILTKQLLENSLIFQNLCMF